MQSGATSLLPLARSALERDIYMKLITLRDWQLYV